MAVAIDEEVLLDYEEAAKLLDISVRTLQRWVCESRVPYVKLPARGKWSGVRFPKTKLLEWIDKRTVTPRNRG